jgi:hypothetical protein
MMAEPSILETAHGVLEETLHGKPPMETIARLAKAVIGLTAKVDRQKTLLASCREDRPDVLPPGYERFGLDNDQYAAHCIKDGWEGPVRKSIIDAADDAWERAQNA